MGTVFEEIESFCSDLHFLKWATSAQNIGCESIDCCLNNSSSRFLDSLDIFRVDSSSAEQVSVCEVLGGQITDRQLGEDDLSSRFNDFS